MRRNLTADDSCYTCHSDKETLLHLFRDCHAFKIIWDCFQKPTVVLNVSQLHRIGWLIANLQCKLIWSNNVRWCDAFVFICWYIWKWRNKRIYDPKFSTPFRPSLIIQFAILEWSSANASAQKLNIYSYCLNMLNWKKPLTIS